MDQNKLKKLKEINYELKTVCGRCEFSVFKNHEWGICKFHNYLHQKHSESKRDLSIHLFGSCRDFRLKENENLHGFKEFD